MHTPVHSCRNHLTLSPLNPSNQSIHPSIHTKTESNAQFALPGGPCSGLPFHGFLSLWSTTTQYRALTTTTTLKASEINI